MRNDSNRPYPGHSFVVFAAILLIAMVAQRASAWLAPLVLALVVAVVATPLVDRLVRRGIPRGVAIGAVFGLVALSIGVVVFAVAQSAREINQNLDSYRAQLESRLAELGAALGPLGVAPPEGGLQALTTSEAIHEFLGLLMTELGAFAGNLLLFILVLVFMLIEIEPVRRRATEIEDAHGAWVRPFRAWAEDVRQYVGLKMITSAVTAALMMLWLALLGVPFVPLWGLLTFLLYFVPNIGSAIVAAAAAIVAFIESGLTQGLLVGLGFGVVTTAMNNVVEPRFFGQRLGIDMTWIVISLVLWGWLLGATGVLLAIPLTLLVKRFLEESERTAWISGMSG